MRKLRWPHVVAFAIAAYAFRYVFSEFLDTPQMLFIVGVIVLYVTAGLWLRYHDDPRESMSVTARHPRGHQRRRHVRRASGTRRCARSFRSRNLHRRSAWF